MEPHVITMRLYCMRIYCSLTRDKRKVIIYCIQLRQCSIGQCSIEQLERETSTASFTWGAWSESKRTFSIARRAHRGESQLCPKHGVNITVQPEA